MFKIRPSLFGGVIYEAEEVDPVLGMPQILLPNQLTNISGTDDDGVLEVSDVTSTIGSCGGTAQPHKSDSARPENRDLRRGRMRDVRHVRPDRKDKRADRDHVKDAGKVVGGRMIGALL